MNSLGAGVSAGTPSPLAVPTAPGWVAVATDGSALGNPGFGGWAWVISDVSWGSGAERRATNNQMELTAVLRALEATRGHVERLEIQSDSKYVIDALTKWIHGWRRRGWKTAAGHPVANREMIEAIDDQLRGREVRFVWVKGHAGHRANEIADTRARWAAGCVQRGEDAPTGPGWAG